MTYAPWMARIGPNEEPDYYDAIMEFESVDAMICDVGSYDDWFPDLSSSS